MLSVDPKSKEVTLADEVKAGRQIFWARRNIDSAQNSIIEGFRAARTRLEKEPEFGLMFPNISRGPEFFGGQDRDLEAFKECFPETPLIGFYGNTEIAPGFKAPVLARHHTTVSALFA